MFRSLITVTYRALRVLALLMMPFVTQPVSAAVMHFSLNGHVSWVDSQLRPTFSTGMPVSLDYVFDSTAGHVNGDTKSYDLLSLYLSIDLFFYEAVLSSPGGIQITDNRDYGNPSVDINDLYILTKGVSGGDIQGLTPDNMQLRFGDRGIPPIDMVTNKETDFVDSLPNLAYFEYSVLQFKEFNNVWLAIDSYSVTTTVPIPPAVLLFGSALGLLGWLRRKISS